MVTVATVIQLSIGQAVSAVLERGPPHATLHKESKRGT